MQVQYLEIPAPVMLGVAWFFLSVLKGQFLRVTDGHGFVYLSVIGMMSWLGSLPSEMDVTQHIKERKFLEGIAGLALFQTG